MDVNFYVVGGVILILAIIVLNHQKQKNKLKNFLEASGDTQPIFLMKAVEKKNKALADILYDGGIKPLAGTNQVTTNATKAALIKEHEKLEKDYASKKITLRTYDEQLFDLLEKANKLKVTA
ncbi:hypothetical protein [Mucilaginibacter sp. UYCu711]|uniref:hypothetical protein n=1 Tax=Mucilaginibacter sp. UYCu711 TaxID=3156339 RepID=UPI003D2205F0